MDEALILEKLDNLSEEIKSLKSGVLEELKQDLMPVIKQATPNVMSFLSDLEGQYSNEDLAHLIKNLLSNIQTLNSSLDMLKAGMELKDDLGPVAKQALPKITDFMGELDGQFDAEELTALLRKTLANLGNFNAALDMLKAGMELKDDMGPVVKQTLPKVTDFMAELDGQFDAEELTALLGKTLANLGNFNAALDMLKAGMELKDDMGPVVKQALPKVTDFMAELDGQFDAEELTALLRKTLANLGNFNAALDMLKAGMELKDDMGPVVKQALPKVTDFMAELDGQFDAEELTALLRKTLANLGNFNAALDMLKAGMELKDDMGPVVKQALPKVTDFMAELDGQFDAEELTALLRKTLANLGNFNAALDMLKAGMELKDDMGPVVKQALPKVTDFMAELDGQFNGEELAALLRNTLSNLHNFNAALTMLKSGMELKDEMAPVVKQLWPKLMDFMQDIQGEFQVQHMGDLVRSFLVNVQTFNRLIGLLKPTEELILEAGKILKLYDVPLKVVWKLNELEQRGIFRIMNQLLGVFEHLQCSEGQMDTMCQAISDIDLAAPHYVGPLEVMNEIRDPNVQETIGAAFKIMKAVGCCLRANRMRKIEEEFPEEFGMTAESETSVQ